MGVATDEKHVDWETVWRGDNDGIHKQTVGYRVPLEGFMPIPDEKVTGPSLFPDADGGRQFLGSAMLGTSVQPCKIIPNHSPPCHVPLCGEIEHHGRYTLLPFDPATMEWVFTSKGQIPEGRTPIVGGYEDTIEKIYHAVTHWETVYVPGKTSPQWGGMFFCFGGKEHYFTGTYLILCWK
ncbi:hypothetical protein FRC19_004779 [Serendipita sp. 401]|nr:hypothetical protein FRC19_004779 [Serendipita sp. 401]